MTETADVVVAGGGHNSLITAAYLARAGLEVLVLDARPEAGGGAATEELMLPGYHFDSCSTGHTLIQTNPVLSRDELGLISEYGLTYVHPDPVAHVVFPDGDHFTMWLDLDRTIDEIARFSKADADAYRQMLTEWDQVKDVFGRWRFNPIGYVPSLEETLATTPGGGRWLRRNAQSSWAVISHLFESRHVRAFLTWMAFQTAQPIDSAGSGALAASSVGGRQVRSWSIPLGGSAALPRALVRAIEDHGGRVLTNRLITGLVLEGDRCVGVETEDGETFMARTAVVSSIHVKSLVEMAPAAVWGDEFLDGVDTFDEGMPSFASYYATTEPPRFLAGDGDTPDRGVRRLCALARGHHRVRARDQGGTSSPRGFLPALRHPDAGRPVTGTGGSPHGEDPQHGPLRAFRGNLGGPTATNWPHSTSQCCSGAPPTSPTTRCWPAAPRARWTSSTPTLTCGTAPSTVAIAAWPTAACSARSRAGPSTGCQSPASTKPAPPPTPAAP